MIKKVSAKSGFTLLEILLVVGIISILAGIVILAINPTKQLGDTRNAQRRSDVLTILNAVYQYSLDNNGSLDTITNSDGPLTPSSTCSDTGTKVNVLSDKLVSASSTYLTAIPHDPNATDAATDAKYYIVKLPSGRLTVCAPLSVGEGNVTSQIEVTR